MTSPTPAIPIACTLTTDEVKQRVEEWREQLGPAVRRAERSSPNRLVFDLPPDPRVAAAIASLAVREKACSAFFEFTLQVETDTVRLVVGVPDGAEPILDEFGGLARN